MPTARDLAIVETRLALKHELVAALLLHLLSSSMKPNFCIRSRALDPPVEQGREVDIARDVIKVSLP